MIIRWGRKGLFAGAIAVAFVTPSVVPVTTYINEVQHRPSFKQEVRHITPVSVAPVTTYINEVQHRPSFKQEVRHITPVSVEVEQGGPSDRVRREREDEEVMELMIAIIGVVDESC